jgi:hypothetical protein
MHDEGGDDFDALARFLAELHAEGGVIDAIGFEQRELDKFLASVSETGPTPTTIPEVKAEDVWVQPGDLFALGEPPARGGRRVRHGAAHEVRWAARWRTASSRARRTPSASTTAEYEDTLPNLRGLIENGRDDVAPDRRPGGFAVLNFGDIAAGREAAGSEEPCEYPMALEYWPVFRAAGWVLWSRRVWCKPNPRVHSPWAIQSNRAATDFEHVWTWKRPGDPIVRRQDGRYASANGWFDTTHEEGVEVGKEVHGAGHGDERGGRMLAIHSERGGIVHEPFAGTGTTIIAAQQLERRCYATELSPRFAQIALSRWERYTGEKAVRREAMARTP